MATPTIYVEAPTRSPRRGGIRSVAEFVSQSRIGMGATLEFTSPGCDFPVGDVVLCYPTPTPAQDPKTLTGIDTLDGAIDPFALYVGVECWLDGGDFEAQARSLLEQGEDRGIEDALDAYFQTLTPTVATSFLEAIAEAEDAADDTYLGRPILLMNRGDAVRADDEGALDHDKATGSLFTVNGTPVVASARLTKGTVAVTGSIAIHHTEIRVTRAPTVTSNTELAIAERVYAVAIDCGFAETFDVTP